MQIRGINPSDGDVTFSSIQAIVNEVSHAKYGDNVVLHRDARPIGKSDNDNYGFQGRIIVRDSSGPGARRSWTGRRMPAACWHVFRDVLDEVFDEFPTAVARTSMARYDGREGFEIEYPKTANVNIGSMVAPAYMPELCDCNDWE